MRNLSVAAAVVVASSVCSAAWSSVTHAMLDDFSAGSPGLGFTRTEGGGASVTAGAGSLPSGGSFLWLNGSGFDASAYSGIAFRITGDLTDASLQMTLMGQDMGWLAMTVDINATVAGGWSYVPWTFFEEGWGPFDNSAIPLTAVAIMVQGGTSPILIDDVMFAVPAPGAAALIGLAGLVAGRRRKA